MASEKFKNIMAIIGGILGTGAVGVAGYSFSAVGYEIIDSVCEDLGTADPFGDTSAMSSEGSVGDLFSGLSASPGEVTTENPIGGTAVGVFGIGVGTTVTASTSKPPKGEGKVKDKSGNVIAKFQFWKRDTTPYSEIERKADSIYKTIHEGKDDCYSYPALIAESKDAFANANELFQNQSSIGRMVETLEVLETVLERLVEQ